MKWTITGIYDADYGCEERMPGEPTKALVYLESEDGREYHLEVADCWLEGQELNEGDEWPIDLDDFSDEEKYQKQARWMEQYMDSLQDMEEEEN